MSGVEWGAPIEVAGKRPDWLRQTDTVNIKTRAGWVSEHNGCHPTRSDPIDEWAWMNASGRPCITAIRLPATHSYYAVQAHNAKHGTNFTYWPGGDCAPGDWDDAAPVLYDVKGHGVADTGAKSKEHKWSRGNVGWYNIIGYTRRPTATDDTVTIKRMTETEAREHWMRADAMDGPELPNARGFLDACRHFGLIREPTQAERIAAKVGLSVAQVEDVLREVE